MLGFQILAKLEQGKKCGTFVLGATGKSWRISSIQQKNRMQDFDTIMPT